MEYIFRIKQNINIFSKLVAIVVCLYYISQAPAYNVSWKLMLYVIPNSWLMAINAQLSTIGTYILLIPLSIVLTSLIYNESKIINGIAALFGVMGTLFIVIKGLKDGTLTEFIDLRIVQVYHEVKLSNKVAFCNKEYFDLVNMTTNLGPSGVIDLLKRTYLTDYYTIHNEIIVNKLKTLAANDIKSYAVELFGDANKSYTLNLQKTQEESWHINEKMIKYLLVFLGILCGLLAIIWLVKYLLPDDTLPILRKSAELGSRSAESQQEILNLHKNYVETNTSTLIDYGSATKEIVLDLAKQSNTQLSSLQEISTALQEDIVRLLMTDVENNKGFALLVEKVNKGFDLLIKHAHQIDALEKHLLHIEKLFN